MDKAPSAAPAFSLPSARTLLLMTWVLGVSIMLVMGCWRSFRLHLSLRRASSPAPDGLKSLLQDVGRSLRLRRVPEVELCSAVRVPSLAGLWRPRILLPPGFAESVPPQTLRMVLGHELAHWRRHDLLWQLLTSALLVLHWFNPLLWLAHHRLREEAEASCDEWMLSRLAQDEARAYGDTLLDLVDRLPGRVSPWRVGEPGLLGMAASVAGVRRRVALIAHWIGGSRASRKLGIIALLVITFLGLLRAAEPVQEIKAALTVGWPATTTLHIFDDKTRDPIAGVKLALKSGKFVHEVTTDDKGRATLNLPPQRPDSSVGFAIRVRKEGRVPTVIFWHLDQPSFTPPDTLDLPLPKAVPIGGIVKDADGKPVSGAQIALIMRGSNMGGATQEIFPDIWERRVPTDANGRWTFTEAPPGRKSFSLAIEHSDIIPLKKYPKGDEVLPFYENRGETIVQRGAVITGKVVDDAGKPVKGTIVLGESGSDSTTYPEYKTNDDGTFRIGNARKGESVMATVTAKGYAPYLTHLSSAGDGAPVVLTLNKGKELKVRVVNAKGDPIAGAMAAPDEWRGTNPKQNGPRVLNYRFTTGKDGTFTWKHAPDVAISWDFFGAEGHRDNRGFVITPGDQEIKVVLEKLSQIIGTVVDADTGAPIPSFKIVPGDVREFPGWKEAGHRSWVWWSSGTMQGTDGKFLFSSDRGRNGEFRRLLRISADGYRPFLTEPIDEISGEVTWNIKLKKTPQLKIQVRQPDGQPAAGAKVSWNNVRNGAARVTNGDFSALDGPVGDDCFFRADTDGVASVAPEVDEFGLVAVHPSGWGVIEPGKVRGDDTITLTPWAVLDLDLRGIPADLRAKTMVMLYAVVENSPGIIDGFHELPKPNAKTQVQEGARMIPGLYKLAISYDMYGAAPLVFPLKAGEQTKIDTSTLWKWCEPALPLKLPPGAATDSRHQLKVVWDGTEDDGFLLPEDRKRLVEDVWNGHVTYKKKDAQGNTPEVIHLQKLGAGSYRLTGNIKGWPAGTPRDKPSVVLATIDHPFTIPASAVGTPTFVEKESSNKTSPPRIQMTGVPVYELPPLEIK